MAFEESTTRTKPKTQLDALAQVEKQRAIDTYRRPFLETIRFCGCHCYLAERGIACGCARGCEHCRSSEGYDRRGGIP